VRVDIDADSVSRCRACRPIAYLDAVLRDGADRGALGDDASRVTGHRRVAGGSRRTGDERAATSSQPPLFALIEGVAPRKPYSLLLMSLLAFGCALMAWMR